MLKPSYSRSVEINTNPANTLPNLLMKIFKT